MQILGIKNFQGFKIWKYNIVTCFYLTRIRFFLSLNGKSDSPKSSKNSTSGRMIVTRNISARSCVCRIKIFKCLQADSKITLTSSRHQLHLKKTIAYAVIPAYSQRYFQPNDRQKNKKIQPRSDKNIITRKERETFTCKKSLWKCYHRLR